MKYNYCPNCGQDKVNQETSTKYVCTNCGYEYWNNPKATVAVLILREDELLFSKRGIEPRKGLYDFPGGFIEYNENPYLACCREVKEETGLIIQPDKLELFDCYNAEYLPGTSVVDMLFVLKEFEGQPIADDDSTALEWKPLDFINTDKFVDYYTDLLPRLKAFLAKNN